MKEILVDTNVLVSFFTDRNQEQQEQAAALFRAAASRELTLAVHAISISEMVYVLRNLYKVELPKIAHAIHLLLAMPGVVSIGEVVWGLVLERWPEPISSLGDAILAAAAVEGGHDAVATFDAPLGKKLVEQGSALYWPADLH
ncbi:MAG TPA: PIN domain-containing protein [Thermoanaerobaculia bacterium]